MKIMSLIAGILLGLLFVSGGLMFLLGMIPKMDPPPEGSAVAHFMAAFGPTGYLTFVKILEVTGGVLIAIPLTRNLGLLVLGPIIVNILIFNILVMQGGWMNPIVIAIAVLALFLLLVERRAFAGLIWRRA